MNTWRPNLRTVVLVMLAAIVTVRCVGDPTPHIAAGIDACSECAMIIDRPNQACGYVRTGQFVVFDSPVCLLRSWERLRKSGEEPPRSVHFADYQSGALYAAEATTFLLTEHVPTAMESGVLCFGDRAAAEAMRVHDDEVLMGWRSFRTARGEPDRVLQVSFGATGMVPEIVEASKGELVLWRARGSNLDHDLVVAVKGYPEVEEFVLPASGEEVAFRLHAERPGAGFPIVRTDDDRPLGMLKVSGAHTADEEAM